MSKSFDDIKTGNRSTVVQLFTAVSFFNQISVEFPMEKMVKTSKTPMDFPLGLGPLLELLTLELGTMAREGGKTSGPAAGL